MHSHPMQPASEYRHRVLPVSTDTACAGMELHYHKIPVHICTWDLAATLRQPGPRPPWPRMAGPSQKND